MKMMMKAALLSLLLCGSMALSASAPAVSSTDISVVKATESQGARLKRRLVNLVPTKAQAVFLISALLMTQWSKLSACGANNVGSCTANYATLLGWLSSTLWLSGVLSGWQLLFGDGDFYVNVDSSWENKKDSDKKVAATTV